MKFILLFLISLSVHAQIQLGSNFSVNTALPIDNRFTVDDLTARDAIPALRRYQGLLVYVDTEEKYYYLKGGIDNLDWTEIGSGAGTGDVVGPLSSNDNGVARFDGLTGKIIQDSMLFIDDGGNLIFTAGAGTGMDIIANSLDASDTGVVSIGGGGSTDRSRGASVRAYGNEHPSSNAGDLNIGLGNVAGSQYRIFCADNTQCHNVDGSSGAHTFGKSAAPTSHVMYGNLTQSSTADVTQSIITSGAGNGVLLDITVQPGGADGRIRHNVNGGQSYTMGIDNSASDRWAMSYNNTLGTADWLTVDTSGNVSLLNGVVGQTGATPSSDTVFEVVSTTEGSIPCPKMTEAQRDAIASPQLGQCVYNTNIAAPNFYDGSNWISAGGGLNKWAASTPYLTGDVIWLESDNQIYRALSDFTSGGTFNPANWQVLASQLPIDLATDVTGVLPIANGGTGSATQNFVDLTTNQSVAGEKTFSDTMAISETGTANALNISHDGTADAVTINHSGSGLALDIVGDTNTVGDVNITGDLTASDQFGASLGMIGNTISAESGGGDASMTLQHQPGGSINRFDGTTYSKLGANPDYQELMKHPSFELGHEGVCSNCDATFVSSITPTPEDKNRLKLTFSGAGAYTVDIDTGAGFSGLPATASCYINTTNTDVQMAQRTNGANGAIEDVVSNGSEVLVIPSKQGLAGTTSTGYQIIAGSAGDVYLNNCSINTKDKVYSVGIQSDPVDCGLTTGDFTNFGTVAITSQRCHREGAFLVMDVKFTAGTPNNAEARVNIKYKGASLTSKSATSIGKVGSYGHGGAATQFHGGFVFAEPSTSYLTFSSSGTFSNSTIDPLAKSDANAVALNGFQVDLNAKIPIANWSATTDVMSAPNNNQTITKILSADVTTNGTTLSDLTFSDLVIGAEYEVNLNIHSYPGAGGYGGVDILHNSAPIGHAGIFVNTSSSGYVSSTVVKFKAQVNTLTFVTSFSGSGTIGGNGTQSRTFAQLRRIDGQFNATLRDVVKSPGSSNGKPVSHSFHVDASGNLTNIVGDIGISTCTIGANTTTCAPSGKFLATPSCQVTEDKATASQVMANYHYTNSTASSLVFPFTLSTNGGSTTPIAITVECTGLAP